MRYRLFFLRKTSKKIIQNKAPLVILLCEILVLVLNQVCSSSLYFPLFASDIPMIPADFWCHCQCNTDDTPMLLPAIIITALLSDFMCNSALLYFQSEAMHPDCAVVVQHMKAQEECNQILKQENNHSSRTGLWVLWSRFPQCSLRLSFEKHSVLAWLMSCCKIKDWIWQKNYGFYSRVYCQETLFFSICDKSSSSSILLSMHIYTFHWDSLEAEGSLFHSPSLHPLQRVLKGVKGVGALTVNVRSWRQSQQPPTFHLFRELIFVRMFLIIG